MGTDAAVDDFNLALNREVQATWRGGVTRYNSRRRERSGLSMINSARSNNYRQLELPDASPQRFCTRCSCMVTHACNNSHYGSQWMKATLRYLVFADAGVGT